MLDTRSKLLDILAAIDQAIEMVDDAVRVGRDPRVSGHLTATLAGLKDCESRIRTALRDAEDHPPSAH